MAEVVLLDEVLVVDWLEFWIGTIRRIDEDRYLFFEKRTIRELML